MVDKSDVVSDIYSMYSEILGNLVKYKRIISITQRNERFKL